LLPDIGPVVAVACTPALLVQACWRADPALCAKPLVIAPPDGQILAGCPLAIHAGVQPGEQVAQARLRCPEVTIRPPDHEAAQVLYEHLLEALATCSPSIEAADSRTGVTYLDARGLSRLWGDPSAVARRALKAASGCELRATAGVGPTRLVALALARRTAAGAAPPVLLDGAASAFLHDLPLDDSALGLTPATVLLLREVGVITMGALARLPRASLALRFDPSVLDVWQAARGQSDAPLRPWTPPERLTVTHRVEEGLTDRTIVEAVLRRLTERLALQLQTRAQATATVTLALHCADGAQVLRRSRHWPPVQVAPALTAPILDLFAGSQPRAPIEMLELHASDLMSPASVQHTLWGDAARDRRGERVAAVLQTHARCHGRSMLRHWHPDPHAADGWSCED
jgi:protein ImuB